LLPYISDPGIVSERKEIGVFSTHTHLRFRAGLVCKAHIILYHTTPGFRVIKKEKNAHLVPRTTFYQPGRVCSSVRVKLGTSLLVLEQVLE